MKHWSEHLASCGTSCIKPHLAWPFPAGTQKAYLDSFAESDWAAKETERKSSSCLVIRLGKSGLEASATSLSNGEAEWYVATRAAACVNQLHHFLQEIGWTPSAACTQRLSCSSRHDDETWIWLGEASRHQSTLVPRSK